MKRREYIQPIVEQTQLMPSSIILSCSTPGLGIGDPISGGEGG